MKILAIDGSTRQSGYTAKALDLILDEAEGMGHDVERARLSDLSFEDCRGCRDCHRTGGCVVDDDMGGVLKSVKESDHIIMASPIYMGSETGVFKCFLDRLYSLLSPMEGGGFESRLPPGKAATVMLVCGSPEGHIVYHYLTNRYTSIIKGLLGMEDFNAFIVPGTSKLDSVDDSVTLQQNLETVKERLC